MSLKTTIDNDIKKAMLAKNKEEGFAQHQIHDPAG